MSYQSPLEGSIYAGDTYGAGASGAAGMGGGAAAAGAGVNWGQVGATAGASALTGILTAMYQAQEKKKQREQEILREQSQNAGQYGQVQNNSMQQLMSNWNRALGV